jgi:uncharacterized protein
LEYSKLSIKAKKSWFVARLITTFIISSILIFGVWFATYEMKLKYAIMFERTINTSVSIIILLLLINTFIYPIIEYKQWRYIINKDKVDFIHGIYTTKRTIVPMIRIQHIVINEGFINRFFNLVNIDIHTAGGVHTIPNIEMEEAKDISDYLRDKISKKVEIYDIGID